MKRASMICSSHLHCDRCNPAGTLTIWAFEGTECSRLGARQTAVLGPGLTMRHGGSQRSKRDSSLTLTLRKRDGGQLSQRPGSLARSMTVPLQKEHSSASSPPFPGAPALSRLSAGHSLLLRMATRWLHACTFQTAPLGFSTERAPDEPAKKTPCLQRHASSTGSCTIIEPCLDRLIIAAPHTGLNRAATKNGWLHRMP